MTGKRHSCSKFRVRKRKLTIMLDPDDADQSAAKEVVSKVMAKLFVEVQKGS